MFRRKVSYTTIADSIVTPLLDDVIEESEDYEGQRAADACKRAADTRKRAADIKVELGKRAADIKVELGKLFVKMYRYGDMISKFELRRLQELYPVINSKCFERVIPESDIRSRKIYKVDRVNVFTKVAYMLDELVYSYDHGEEVLPMSYDMKYSSRQVLQFPRSGYEYDFWSAREERDTFRMACVRRSLKPVRSEYAHVLTCPDPFSNEFIRYYNNSICWCARRIDEFPNFKFIDDVCYYCPYDGNRCRLN